MANTVVLTITTGSEATQTIKNIFLKPTSIQREQARAVGDYFLAAAAGLRTCSFDSQVNGGASVAASGTYTFSGAASASDTVLINGVTFTAETSGATGNQWNIGSSATQTATNLAAAINGSATAGINTIVSATSALGVVTITALVKGTIGNAVTIAKGTDSGSVNTVSGARLTGGVNTTTNVYHYGL